MGRGVWAQVPESFHAMGEQGNITPLLSVQASPCNRRSLNPPEDKITRNRMMHATEDEVCEWFPGGRGVTEKPASW